MFNNMKNKIREKTGTEIPKFVPNSKLSVTSSRQGSETSLNSLSCPITDVNSNSGAIIQKTSDFREIDESSYNEWLKKEEEFQKILTEKENEWRKKEQNYLDQMEVKQKELAETMKQVEDSRNKIIRYQEDKDQLEQYQLQEMSKIKHLLLTKEKENCENAAALKESLALVENLKHEVTRLRPLEEQISNYESSTESETNTKYAEVVKELEDLKAKLEDSEIQSNFTNEQLKIDVQSLMQSLEHEKLKVRELEQSLTKEKAQRDDVTLRNAEMTRQIAIFAESVKELQDLKAKLEDSEIQSNFTNEQLKIDVQSLMQSLEHEKLKIRELEESLTEERRQRDEAFLRNAEMSQQMQIAQSDLRTAQQDNDELLVKLNASEQAAQSRTSDLDLLKLELNELRSQVGGSKLSDVENELNEKNKTVRMLQQRLSDLKKTLQQELRNNSAESRNHTNLSQNHSNESQNHTSQSRNHSNESKNNTSGEDTPPAQLVGSSTSSSLEDDVNFKYLKHVIIKFLTCRDYEAQHLTRAVAVLLRLSAEEEQSLKDTLDTRGSWWSSRPRILPR